MTTLRKISTGEVWGKFEEVNSLRGNGLKRIRFMNKDFKDFYTEVPKSSNKDFIAKALIAEFYPSENLDDFIYE